MDTLEIDPTHKSEVRMYSRGIGPITELVFVDHDGHERVVGQWDDRNDQYQAPKAVSVVGNSSSPNFADVEPAWGEPEHGELGRLLKTIAEAPEAPVAPSPIEGQAASTEAPVDDTARRRAAKAAIRTAVATISRNTYDLQMRYELALQARNKQTRALELFDREAKAAGVPLATLIEQVIADRKMREATMMRVFQLQAEGLANLDRENGAAIEALEAKVLTEINGHAD